MRERLEELAATGDGAVFGKPDFREVSAGFTTQASSTAALFWASQFETYAKDGWPTNDWRLRRAYQGEYGPGLTNILNRIGELPNGASCAGVLIGEGIVVTSSHCVINFICAPQELRVVFGFAGKSPEGLRDYPIEKLCFERTSPFAMIQLRASDEELAQLPPIQPIEPDEKRVDETTDVVAFGHPLGSARLMTGANDHTHIRRCESGVRTTLDSLKVSSGSPVFIPRAEPDEEWILFGLLEGNAKNNLRQVDGKWDIDVVAMAPNDPCEGGGVGPTILPLPGMAALISTFSSIDAESSQQDEDWTCFTPSCLDRGCDC